MLWSRPVMTFSWDGKGQGTLNLSAGQLRAGYTVIGKFGTGLWNQSGGLFDQDFGDVEIGDGGTPDQAGPGPRVGTLNLIWRLHPDGRRSGDRQSAGNRHRSTSVEVCMAATGVRESHIFIGRGTDSGPGIGGPRRNFASQAMLPPLWRMAAC